MLYVFGVFAWFLVAWIVAIALVGKPDLALVEDSEVEWLEDLWLLEWTGAER